MRWFALACLLAAPGPGQEEQTSTYVYDLSGRKVGWSRGSAGEGRRSETLETVNGRRTTMEQVEERVLRSDGGVKVVERITRRFDQDGRPLPVEKTVTETATRPDGGMTESVAVWRGDLNGRMQLAERATSETTKSGSTLTTQTRVERPSPGGGLALAERREMRQVGSGNVIDIDELVLRPDANGRLAQAARKVVQVTKRGNQSEEHSDEYEATTTGALQLSRRTVSISAKDADGGEQRVVDVYGLAAPGRPISGGHEPQLRERQFYSTKAGADGSTVESFSVQRPSLADSKELGPVVKISETVCAGKCK